MEEASMVWFISLQSLLCKLQQKNNAKDSASQVLGHSDTCLQTLLISS